MNEPQAAAVDVHLTLKYPVTINGVQVLRLKLRRPTLRDLRRDPRMGGNKGKQAVHRLAALTGIAPKVIEQLDAVDFLALAKQAQALIS